MNISYPLVLAAVAVLALVVLHSILLTVIFGVAAVVVWQWDSPTLVSLRQRVQAFLAKF